MTPVKEPRPFTSEQRVGDLVREARGRQGLSLRTLATRAGFSPSFVSQVERGQTSPSIASLERLALALEMTLGDFFRPLPAPAAPGTGARPAVTSACSRVEIEALGPAGPGHRLEPLMITLAPGGQSGERPTPPGAEAFAIVFEGEVRLTLGETVLLLARGDAATLAAEMPHRWENASTAPARIVVVSVR